MEQQESSCKLTFGERAVGLTFNPGGHPQVEEIKTKCAAAIDAINSLKESGNYNGEAIEQLTLAIRCIQEGQMWAVKGVTWQY